jgi:ribonuclease T2
MAASRLQKFKTKLTQKKKSMASLLLLAALLGLAAACDWSDMNAACTYTTQADWAYLVFAQTWPGTFCSDGCCRTPSGVSKIATGFTIHGLWPNYDSNAYPTCCTNSFSDAALTNLINGNAVLGTNLETYWPALKKCLFVQYEFDKHGSCAVSAWTGSNGPVDYWNAAMYLRKTYDIYSALVAAGIKPGTAYYDPYKQVVPAIQNYTGTKIHIHCDHTAPTQLLEVRMCVARPTSANKLTPKIIDCPATMTEADGCDTTRIQIPAMPTLVSNGC